MATNIELVQQLYVAYFNRPGDVGGLNFYVDVLNRGAASIDVISADFAKSVEYTGLFAGKSNEQVVGIVYQNLFGRLPDQGGLNFWVDKLDRKIVGISDVVKAIAAGAINADGTPNTDGKVYANKVTAAVAFTEDLTLPGNEANRIAYSSNNPDVKAIAKNFISNVTDDASLAAAKANVAAITDSIGELNNPGKTFNLSQGQDSFTGDLGNDIFNAAAFNSVTGAAVTTLHSVDVLDGGAGKDTLNIEIRDVNGTDTTNYNGSIVGTIKNIEVINLDATLADTAGLINVDASKFQGATVITQIGNAKDIGNVAANTTAGFKNITGAGTYTVTTATGVTSAQIALTNVQDTVQFATVGANTVTVSGTVVDAAADGVGSLAVSVTAAKDAQTVTVNSAVAATLAVNEGAGATKNVTTVDASASTGAITFKGATSDASIVSIKTGSGNDDVKLATATSAAAAGVAAVVGAVATGTGNDKIEVAITGDGGASVDAGAGNDTVTITTRGTGVLTVKLGEGDDVFKVAAGQSINATDVIDGGAGKDTLTLNLVGSANIGAFSNFDAFDAAGLAKTLDVDILATKNTVTEFSTTGDVGAAAVLTNVGANVGYRVLGDTTLANALTLTQKVGGDITLTMDIDETTDGASVVTATDAAVVLTNATSAKVVFDADFAGKAASATDNLAQFNIDAAKATTISVASGGDFASNIVNLANVGELTTVTVTGAAALKLDVAGGAKLTSVDASAATGGLTADLADLKAGGVLKLGTGVDVINVAAVTAASAQSISGFEKAAAAAVGADATAKTAAIADADKLAVSGAVADALSVAGGDVTAKGVLTFTGAGPSTLDAAIAIANLAADANGETLVFEYLGNSYVFSQVTAGTDVVVKLTGITGITNIVEDGATDTFFIV